MERILYLVSESRSESIRNWFSNDRDGKARTRSENGEHWFTARSPVDPAAEYKVRFVTSGEEAHRELDHHYFNLIIVDQRGLTGVLKENEHLRFVEKLHYSSSPEKMFPMNRVILILDDNAYTSRFAFHYGKLKVGDYIVNPNAPGEVLNRIHDVLVLSRKPGKVALCLAGGGVEGLLYELGVIQALDDMLIGKTANDFDMYFGISAGSILATYLAFGLRPQKLIDAFLQKGGTLPPIKPQIIYDLAVKDSVIQFFRTVTKMRSLKWSELASSAFKLVPSGFFKGDNIRKYVEEMFEKNKLANRFAAAKKPLYIGATNQDTSEHVIFGVEGWRHVPISKAVRASCSLTPFFKPERIDNAWYCDGQFTRTSNFHYAIEQGANLIIIVNPLVPIDTGNAGYVMKKGGFFEALQGLKAVINTRFLTAIHHAAESFPDVDFFVFRPEQDDMKVMGGSPLKYAIRSEIIHLAYNGVVKKIDSDFEIFQKKFEKHGLSIQKISPV